MGKHTLTLLWCCATIVLGGAVQAAQTQAHDQELPARIRGLLAALSDPDDRVFAAALQSLKMEKFQKEQIWRLGSLLKDPDERVRREGALLLGTLGVAAKEHSFRLGNLLKDPNKRVCRAAVWALGAMGAAAKEQAPRLGDLLKDPDWKTRYSAALALGAMGEAAKEQAPRLGELLKDPEGNVREAAAQALGAMGEVAKEQALLLGNLLKDPEGGVRHAAVKALQAMGTAAKEQAPLLIDLLKDPNPDVRAKAAQTLYALGAAAREQGPHLGGLLRDPDQGVRYIAAKALGVMGEAAKEQAPLLVDLLKDPDWNVREVATKALQAMGAAAAEQAPRLGDLLKDPEFLVRSRAAQVLQAMGEAGKQTQRFGDLLKHSNAESRREAAQALGALGPAAKEQASRLANLLKDPDDGVRSEAAQALGALGPAAKEQAPRIGGLLKDPHGEVRRAAVEALGGLGAAAKEQIPRLVGLLKDPDQRVQYAAAQALGHMGAAAKEQAPRIVGLLKDPSLRVRYAAVQALGDCRRRFLPQAQEVLPPSCMFVAMGEAAREQAPRLVDLLTDPDEGIRTVAADGLQATGATATGQAPRLVDLLKYPNQSVRSAAAEALLAMGEAAKEQAPRLVGLLSDPDQGVRQAALKALGDCRSKPHWGTEKAPPPSCLLVALGEAAKEQAPRLVDLLSEPDEAVRQAAVEALGAIGPASQEQAPRLVDLLKDSERAVRQAAATVLGAMGAAAREQVPRLGDLLKEPEMGVRQAAATALGAMGAAAGEQAPLLAGLLQDPSWGTRVEAIKALGAMGATAKEQAPHLGDVLKDPDDYIRRLAVQALGEMGAAAKEQAPRLVGLLKDPDSEVRSAAVQALGAMGELDRQYAPLLLEFLLEDARAQERDRAGRLLMTMAPLELQQIATLLALAARDPESRGNWLLRAHVAGGGAPPVEHILRWVVGRRSSELPMEFELAEARETLRAFAELWPHTEKHPALRDELAQQIARVAALANGQWESTDVELLELHEANLRASHRMYADNLQAATASLEHWGLERILLSAWAGHICFWVLLLFFYPYSPQVQAFFFWNSRVRTIMGFWYVGLLLTLWPLRNRLLAPFARHLLADAGLERFPAESYFKDSEVLIPSTGKRERLLDALPRLRGRVILEGASGLGKSLFIKYLLRQSKRLAVFLPAQRCREGVLEAIQEKLLGHAQDISFLQSIIHNGALDIYIDGFNEVSADTRSRIVQFVERPFAGNILLATQDMKWTPPSTVRLHVLQPLSKQQVSEFLASQLMQVEEKARQEYPARCARFVEEISSPQQPQGLSPAMSEVLSNPMDLSIIAQMLAKGYCPNPFDLREQQYTLMAADYTARNLRDFPLTAFSEEAYKMRLEEQLSLPEERFKLELLRLEDFKIVVRREWRGMDGKEHREWRFRHDKLQEFFIAKTFLGENNPRIDKHMDDPRFRGVYLLLALRLELESARQLHDKLVLRAAQTGDHGLSREFFTTLEARLRAQQAHPPVPGREQLA